MSSFQAVITDDPDLKARSSDEIVVFAPGVVSVCAGLPLDLAALPLSNLNSAMLDMLERLEPGHQRSAYCAVFPLDPLFNRAAFADAVVRAGFRGLCNFPPLPSFGPEERAALEASGYSMERTAELLTAMAGDRLDVAFCPSLGAVECNAEIPMSLPAGTLILSGVSFG